MASSERGDDQKIPRIKKAEITLNQVEDSVKLTNMTNRNEVYKRQISTNEIDKNVDDSNNGSSINFEIPLSDRLQRKKNYAGKCTAYYWLLEAKVDMGLARHFHKSTIIEVA